MWRRTHHLLHTFLVALRLEMLVPRSNVRKISVAVQAIVLAHAGEILIHGQRPPLLFRLLQGLVHRVVAFDEELGAAGGLVGEASLLDLPVRAFASHGVGFSCSLGGLDLLLAKPQEHTNEGKDVEKACDVDHDVF